MKKVKVLAVEFNGKTLPSASLDALDNLHFPLLAVATPPKGIKIFIRSGILFLEDMRQIKNQNLKKAINRLLGKSSSIKTTIEGVIYFKDAGICESTAIMSLLSLRAPLDGFEVVLTDMVFEHTPNIKAEIRLKGLLSLFRETETDRAVRTIRPSKVSNRKELAHLMDALVSVGNETVSLLDCDGGYPYQTPSGLDEAVGVNVALRQTFRGRILDIVPKLKTSGTRAGFTADYIVTEIDGDKTKVPVTENNDFIFDRRKELIGKLFTYSGVQSPSFSTPTRREFIEVLKVLV